MDKAWKSILSHFVDWLLNTGAGRAFALSVGAIITSAIKWAYARWRGLSAPWAVGVAILSTAAATAIIIIWNFSASPLPKSSASSSTAIENTKDTRGVITQRQSGGTNIGTQINNYSTTSPTPERTNRPILKKPITRKDVPINQRPAFEVSGYGKADLRRSGIYGDVPHGLARVRGHGDISIEDSIIATGDPAVLFGFPTPTGEFSEKTNVQLRSAVADISKRLVVFRREQESAFDSIANITDNNVYQARSEDIARNESQDFNQQFAEELLSLGSELVTRTSSHRPNPPAQREIREGWDEARTGKLAEDPTYAIDFLNWLVAKLPSH
jgi:hypothetical protein